MDNTKIYYIVALKINPQNGKFSLKSLKWKIYFKIVKKIKEDRLLNIENVFILQGKTFLKFQIVEKQ